MPLSFEKKIATGFIAAVVFMLAIGGTAWWGAIRFGRTFRWVDHTHQVIYQLEACLVDMLNMQTATRGYLLTGKESFLKPYEAGAAATGGNLRTLGELTRDNAVQQKRFVQLDDVTQRLMAIMRERIALRRAGDLAAAAASPALESGNNAITEVRELIRVMETEERRLLAERSAAAQHEERLAVIVFGLGTLAATGVVALAGSRVLRDSRQRQLAEQTLQHERYLMTELMARAPERIYFKDLAGNFLRINTEYANRLGLGHPVQAVGKTDFDFFTESHARQTRVDEEAVIATGQPVAREEKEVWLDGHSAWLFTTKLPLRDPSGRITGVLGLSRDITARKQVELLHQQFRALFESIPGAYLVLTPDFKIAAVSDAYLKATLTQRAQIVGRGLFEVFPDNPDDPSANGTANLRSSLQRVLQDSQPDTMAIQRYAIRRNDGTFEERFWSPVNSPVLGPDRQLEYIIHRVEDVTDFIRQKQQAADGEAGLHSRMQQMEAEIFQSSQKMQQSNQKLLATNAELEAFSYSVSHDLRAPLRHIDGFSNLLLNHSGPVLDDQGKRYLSTISSAARQMGRLIDDLLGFSRMGRIPMKVMEVDQNELVAAVIRDGRFDRNGTVIEWQIASLPAVRADAALLRQVWANFLDNAVKYSSKTPRPRIEVGCLAEAGADEQVFFVRDNGAGFDMRYVDKLFGVFQRLHTAGEFEGTGIGLANVRRIVSRHHGRTWAEGTPGQGATFYFSLPAPTPTVS